MRNCFRNSGTYYSSLQKLPNFPRKMANYGKNLENSEQMQKCGNEFFYGEF